MNKKEALWQRYAAFSLAALLSACGGGGSSSSPTPTPAPTSTTISGTAATGAAMAGAAVEIKDINGLIRTATTTVDGNYTLDVNGLTGPFLIKVTGIDGTVVYSAALPSDVGGIINATPLTSIIVADATNQSPDTLFNSYGNPSASLLTNNLASAVTTFTGAFTPIGTALGFTVSETGLLRGTMSANHQGLDKALDALDILFSGSTVTIADKSGVVLATVDLSSAPLTINSSDVSAQAATMLQYAQATSDIAALLDQMTTDCGHPTSNDINNDVYSSSCTVHFNTTAFLNEGVTNAAEFSSGWGWLAANSASISFMNPVIFGYDTNNGYKARYTYSVTVGAKTQIFQSEGYFKDESGTWKFQGDQQYLALDINAHRKLSSASTSSDVNIFKLFATTGASSWSAVAHNGLSIDYVVVTGPGLPSEGLTLSTPTKSPDQQSNPNNTALYACVGIQGNANTPCYQNGTYDAAKQDGINFTSGDSLTTEGTLVPPENMKRYIFTAYHGTVGSGTALYSAPYWLPLRYEYFN